MADRNSQVKCMHAKAKQAGAGALTMANTKLAALATCMLVIVLLLQAPCALSRRSCSVNGDAHCSSSPAVSSSKIEGMPAVMTVNGFGPGGSGGGPAECDGQYHSDRDMLVALSTEWYLGGRRCQRLISIRSTSTGRTAVARVVDECDSRRGCKNNIIDTSPAVWSALGLDTNVGEVPVTWSDA